MLHLMQVPHMLILGLILLLTGCGTILQQDDQLADGKAGTVNVLPRESYTTEESYVRSLVEHLESPEVVLRMVAISRLNELTGKSLGYRFDSSITKRNEAVKKWVAWFSAQKWDTELNMQNQGKDDIDA